MIKITILLSILLGSFGSYHHAHASTTSEIAVIDAMNKERSKYGLPKLKLNTKLTTATRLKVKDMQDKHYWNHYAPSGTSPFKWIDDAQYTYRYAGENLARGFTTVGATMKAWMASPTHRKNILNPAYRDTGLTIISTGAGSEKRIAIVNMFGAI